MSEIVESEFLVSLNIFSDLERQKGSITCTRMIYGHTLYGRHKAKRQVQYSKIKVIKSLSRPEITFNRRNMSQAIQVSLMTKTMSGTTYDGRIYSYVLKSR